jgi:hypothetical protein
VAGVSSAIAGTASAAHLGRLSGFVAAGALPPERVEALRAAFRRGDQGWVGQV